MTEAEHAEIVKAEAEGRLRIGVDRTAARRFYTDTPLRSIYQATGEGPYLEKLVTYICFIGGPVALLIAVVLSVIYFSWWSVALAPIAVFVWVSYYGASARGSSGLVGITIVLLAVFALHIFNPFSFPGTLFYVFLALALWLGRCLYVTSTMFVRAFIVRNHRALAVLSTAVVLRKV